MLMTGRMHARYHSNWATLDYWAATHNVTYTIKETDKIVVEASMAPTPLTPPPCPDYGDVVDFRIIVLACNRPDALRMLLDSLDTLHLDGATSAVDIWIDRNKHGVVNNLTVDVARSFTWKGGASRVHIWPRHVGIYGQWIDTWCPAPYTNVDTTGAHGAPQELALMLEEDIVVSPMAWRWLKAAEKTFGHRLDVAGYSLQSEGVLTARGSRTKLHTKPTHHSHAYRVLGTWGFAPHAARWAEFRQWYYRVINEGILTGKPFKPYVDNIVMTLWYKNFERTGRSDSMWSMWFVYFADENGLFTIYNNFHQYLGQKNRTGENLLALHNVKFGGLHYAAAKHIDMKRLRVENDKRLLSTWEDDFGVFPADMQKFEFDGKASVF